MDAVAFTPYPEFGHDCVFCFSCMKQCSEQAIKVDFSEIWQRIKDRAAFFSEHPHSQIFLKPLFAFLLFMEGVLIRGFIMSDKKMMLMINCKFCVNYMNVFF